MSGKTLFSAVLGAVLGGIILDFVRPMFKKTV